MLAVKCFIRSLSHELSLTDCSILVKSNTLVSLGITSKQRTYSIAARENEGTEREAPGPALGICHVHESYF